MKVSTEIDNNFGYEKITQLVDNIPLNQLIILFTYILLPFKIDFNYLGLANQFLYKSSLSFIVKSFYSHDLDHNTPPRELQKRKRSTHSRYHIKGRPQTPTNYRNEEESQKPWKRCTFVRSPYMPELLCHKTEFIDGTESYSEIYYPDDPTLMDCYPRYDTDIHLGDRPSTPIQQRDVRFTLKASRKKQHAYVKRNLSQYLLNTNN